MGAVKRIALRESGDHKISLDQVIETMYPTGLDMQSHYKETSLETNIEHLGWIDSEGARKHRHH